MTPRSTRYIIVDTSVLLHDPQVVGRYPDHVVVITHGSLATLLTVGRQTTELGRNARQAAGLIELAIDTDAADETVVKPGKVYIAMGDKTQVTLSQGTPADQDDATVGVADQFATSHGVESTLLLSRDAAIRALGIASGVRCQAYQLHAVQDAYVDNGLIIADERLIKQCSFTTNDAKAVARSHFDQTQQLAVGNIVIDADQERAIAIVSAKDDDNLWLRPLEGQPDAGNLWGISARNQQQAAVLGALCDADIDLVSVQGDAGTGKTLLALAAGLHLVFDRELYDEVLITRATVSVGDDIGFLPGTEEEKMHPWMGAIEDSLDLLLPQASEQAGRFGKGSSHDLVRKRIKVRSMSFMRGRTFTSRFVIIDEAQNLTPHEMRMMISRAGQGTKVVCLGNMQQIDTPWISPETSGLTWLNQHFKDWPYSTRIVLRQVERSRLADKVALALPALPDGDA